MMLNFVPYHHTPPKIFNEFVELDPIMLKSVPDHLMTQEMCNKLLKSYIMQHTVFLINTKPNRCVKVFFWIQLFWNLFLTILKFKRYVKKKLLLDALLYWNIVLIDTKLLICVKKVVDAYPMILRYICYWFVRPEMSKVLYNENFHFNDPYEHFTWHDEHNQHKACKKLLYKESKLIAWHH